VLPVVAALLTRTAHGFYLKRCGVPGYSTCCLESSEANDYSH